MKRHIIFDKNQRSLIVETRHLSLLQFNKFLQPKFRVLCFPLFSLSKIRNYCVISGRSRGVFRFSRMSRQFTRDYIGRGLLGSFSKSSW